MSTPDELWVHALTLVEAADDEVTRRHAVSRLYYATFHAVRALLSLDTRGANAHERLIQALKESEGPQRIIAASRLDSLRKVRVHADYHLGLAFGRETLPSARNHALNVRRLLGME